MRKCKNCGKEGHYKPRCPEQQKQEVNISEQGERKTLKDIGREILEQQNQVVEREPDEVGTLPAKGLWIVNPEKKKVAGKISQIKKDGTILWTDAYGSYIESSPETIKSGGYRYLELQSIHLRYEVILFPK